MKKTIITVLITTISIFGMFVSAKADTITKPYNFTNGTPADADEVNANFDTVYNHVNKFGSMITVDDINGRVGFGTTSPDSIFEFASDYSISGTPSILSVISYYNGSTAHPAHLTGRRARGTINAPSQTLSGDHLFLVGARGYSLTSGFNHTTNASISFFATENFTDTAMGTNIRFRTTPNGTIQSEERMRIDQNGNVGIGTSDPQTVLEVAQDGIMHITATSYNENGGPGGAFSGRRARGTMSSPTAVLADDVLAKFGGFGYGETDWPTQRGAQTRASMNINAAENWTDDNQGAFITFQTTPIGGGSFPEKNIERMRIDDSGNVGIGTTTPQSKLQVTGYVQLDLTPVPGSPPPADDCNESAEYGRMMVDDGAGLLYICVAGGWVAK